MRRVLLLCAALVLLAGPGWADGERIGYHPPQLLASSLGFTSPGTQVFKAGDKIYFCNTADCTTVYERVAMWWSSNQFRIDAQNGGGGTQRALVLRGSSLIFDVGTASQWSIISTALQPIGDATETLGITTARVKTLYLAEGLQGAATTALTGGAATGFVEIAVAQGTSILGEVTYKIEAKDAANIQVIGGRLRYSAVNEGGTVACTVADVGTAIDNTPTGTLTNTFTCAEDNPDKIMLKANAVSSLSETSLQIVWRADAVDVTVITPQT